MDTAQLATTWDRLRLAHGVALRLIEMIPESRLDDRLVPGMRTPKQLVVHLYVMGVRELMVSVARGELREIGDDEACAPVQSKDALVELCRDSWQTADAVVRSITDAQLEAVVKTPWGRGISGKSLIGVARDEFHHHRGQLYTYVRLMGLQPPDMYDFANNAEEFRPKAAATAQ